MPTDNVEADVNQESFSSCGISPESYAAVSVGQHWNQDILEFWRRASKHATPLELWVDGASLGWKIWLDAWAGMYEARRKFWST